MDSFDLTIKEYLDKKIDKNNFYQKFEKQYQSKIVGLLFSICPNANDIEDIYQEVFIRFHNKLGAYQLNTNFTAWIIRLARNVAYDYQRSETRKKKDVESIPGDLKYEGPGPKTENIEKEISTLLNQALSGIPIEYREPIFLKYHAGLTFDEIVKITGTPLSTIKHRFRKGMNLLNSVLKSLNPDNPLS